MRHWESRENNEIRKTRLKFADDRARARSESRNCDFFVEKMKMQKSFFFSAGASSLLIILVTGADQKFLKLGLSMLKSKEKPIGFSFFNSSSSSSREIKRLQLRSGLPNLEVWRAVKSEIDAFDPIFWFLMLTSDHARLSPSFWQKK